jgi:hypothetical protein
MSYTKRQFVTEAFAEIGLGTNEFDIGPEYLQMGLKRLDRMMAEWNGKGIRLFYPIPTSPENSDLDEETRVPDVSNEAVVTNLAIRISTIIGKIVSPETKFVAKQGYNTLLSIAAMPPQMRMPKTMPAGAGHKTWRTYDDPFIRQEKRQLEVGPDSFLEPL